MGIIITSCENNMSLVLLFQVVGEKFLFTGDTGTMGLYKAIYYAKENKIDLKTLTGFQVPHHGSRRNLSKGILDPSMSRRHSSVPQRGSQTPLADSHQRPVRADQTFVTQGTLLCQRSLNLPIRLVYMDVCPCGFQSHVAVPRISTAM